MPASTSPFFNINYGWSYGESGWNSGMDDNLQVMSFLDKGAVNDIVSTLPSSPAQGYSVINTTDNLLYYYVNAWRIVTPQEGMNLYVISIGKDYKYLPSGWTEQPSTQTLKTSVDTLQAFNTNLVGTGSSSGSALIPRNTQVVSTVAALKALNKNSASKFALLAGYYALGDTGRSRLYYLDAADTTSADNGGTIIVATDGGRWKMSDRTKINFKDFGCKVDGITDDTIFAQNALNVVINEPLEVCVGTMIVTTLQGFTGTYLVGSNKQRCIIKRKPSDTGNNPTLYFVGKNKARVENFTIDGNKANQTVNTNNLIIVSGCYDMTVKNIISQSCKGGNGITVLDTADQTNLTSSTIEENYIVSNDGVGINISRSFFFTLNKNTCIGNTLDGISVANLTNPPPVSPTEQFYKITNNTLSYNSGSGLGVSGYIDAYTAGGLQITGADHPTTYGAVISGNTITSNIKYGLAFQSRSTLITNNVICNNGDSSLNGGVLLNSSVSLFSNNIVDSNFFYGIDAGGALNTIISHNQITNNGTSAASGGCSGVNLGAGQGLIIDSNTFRGNGNSVVGGSNINIRGFDGGTDPVFNTLSRRIFVKNNYIHLVNNLAYGLTSSEGLLHLVVKNNEVFGGDQFRAFSIRSQTALRSGNNHWPFAAADYSVASATSVVIPDAVERINITGTGNINNLYTDGANYYLGRISNVNVLTGGSGYTPGARIALTFSGGGATTQATANGVVNNSGVIAAVEVTGLGSGYTSAPTITPASGTATFSATVGLNNTESNEIQVFLSSTAVLVSGAGNMQLSGGNFTGNNQKMITLYGRNGVWFEKGRS